MTSAGDSPRSYDAVIFDKDGTLIGLQETWAPALASTLSTIADNDSDLEAELDRLAGLDRAQMWILPHSAVLAGSTTECANAIASALPHVELQELIDRLDALMTEAGRHSASPLPSTEPLLASLHRDGVAIGLATNDSEISARIQLEQLGWLHYFSAILGYDSGAGAKPNPKMLVECARSIGVELSRCVFVGDTETDRQTGANAGVRTIIITEGTEGQTVSPFQIEPGDGPREAADPIAQAQPEPVAQRVIEVGSVDEVAEALARFDLLAAQEPTR